MQLSGLLSRYHAVEHHPLKPRSIVRVNPVPGIRENVVTEAAEAALAGVLEEDP